ncbi:hypothetical protein ABT215_39930 [Streptomyces sp900105755]|uniref:hypothetical protein n=1 Tax=Streptomyces sp. 900105755 TaxID=3154389 RepID=UPI00331E30E8
MSELIVKGSDGLKTAYEEAQALAARFANIGKSLMAATDEYLANGEVDETEAAFREQFIPGSNDLHKATTLYSSGIQSTAENLKNMGTYLNKTEEVATEAAHKLNSPGHVTTTNNPSAHSAPKSKH